MPSLTAGEVVVRIKAKLGIPWRDTTYRDTFKFGSPDTEVKAIATTVFCSFDLIQRAAHDTCVFEQTCATGGAKRQQIPVTSEIREPAKSWWPRHGAEMSQ